MIGEALATPQRRERVETHVEPAEMEIGDRARDRLDGGGSAGVISWSEPSRKIEPLQWLPMKTSRTRSPARRHFIEPAAKARQVQMRQAPGTRIGAAPVSSSVATPSPTTTGGVFQRDRGKAAAGSPGPRM